MARSSNARLLAAALAGTAVASGVIADRRWRAAEDPCAGCELPDGEQFKVETDDGAVLDGEVHGDGPTVVLSHCWTGSRAVWAPVASRLLDSGHRVVLYDQRGHGRSTYGEDHPEVQRLGTDLAEVLEAVDARRSVVAGHSMGGMAVQAMAIHHPDVVEERVEALALVATAAGGLSSSPIAGVAPKVVGSKAVERAMRARFGHALVRRTVGKGPRYGQLHLTREAFVSTPAHVRRGLLESMFRMDHHPHLERITVPTAVVHGPRDTLTPPSAGRALAEAIPNATAVHLPGAGHMLPLERPDEVAKVIAGLAPDPGDD